MTIRKLYLATLFLAVFVSASAQLHNNIYVSAAGNYSALLDYKHLAKPNLGAGGNVGVGYELQYRRFLMDVGLEASFDYMLSKIPDTQLDIDAIDTDGDEFIFHHTFAKNKNVSKMANVSIPLMFGSKLGTNFYFLLGGKFSFNVWGQTNVNSLLSTSGTYKQLTGEFVSMPNHQFFYDEPISGNNLTTRFAMNASACAEAGYVFSAFTKETGFDVPKVNAQYRVALFASYGLLNIHPNTSAGSVLGNTFRIDGGGSEPINYSLTHVYLSNEAENAIINNLNIGVKFTVLFKLPEPKSCVICRETEPVRHSSSAHREVQRLIDAQ